MIRSALAVISGFLVMTIVVMVGTVLAVRYLLGRSLAQMREPASVPPPRRYVATNLVVSAIAAVLGGYVTAAIAIDHRLRHGAVLAVVMVLMGAASMRQAGKAQPRWYQLTILFVMPLLALAGAAME